MDSRGAAGDGSSSTPPVIEVLSDDEPVVIDLEDEDDVIEINTTNEDQRIPSDHNQTTPLPSSNPQTQQSTAVQVNRNQGGQSENNILLSGFDGNMHLIIDDVQIMGERPIRRPVQPPAPFVRRRPPPRRERRTPRTAASNRAQFHRFVSLYGHLIFDPSEGRPHFQNINDLAQQYEGDDDNSFWRHISMFLPSEDEDEDPDFIEGRNQLLALAENDYIENSIMRRIERENEAAMNSRFEAEKRHNLKVLAEKKEAQVAKGYTTMISPQTGLCCELCGITLGEGISADFRPDPRYDENIETYAQEYQVNAPWFCARQISDVDVELLKRIFVAKCGHVFCGRCVRNIGSKPKRTRSQKMSIMSPNVYAPAKCTAVGCLKRFTPKSFVEVYY